jgi:hypothetical protein
VWQQIYRDLPGPRDRGSFEFVAIAVDPGGPEQPRPFVEAAGATFPVLVDSTGLTSAALGFKVVPNGILVDEEGIVRYRKDGSFSNANPDDRAALERFARGEDPGASPDGGAQPYQLGALEQELVQTKMELGRLLEAAGRRAEAIARWREALHLDPENKTIRKAIWAVEHPERFHPTIDAEWQVEQLARERDEEIAAGICGPDGCPLPER